mmetsp:Transcript_4934/g.17731  ORF Transcript_4934/g.17731 Transcript_4934/m.17731 type:complete len:673 (-) Transcript_4934:1368-3386(-)
MPVVGVVGVHGLPVEAAGVADISLVAAGLHMTVHPRDHVAAIAAAGGDDALAGHPGLLQQPVGAGLDVLQLELAPVAGDAVQELEAEARRAVVVHAGHHIARGREDLVVPAPVPAVAKGRVRATVDDMHHGPLLLGVEVGRVDQPHLHLVAARALERHFLVAAETVGGQTRVIEGLDAAQAVLAEHRQPRRELHAVVVDDDGVRAGAETADVAAFEDGFGQPLAERELPEVAAAAVLGREEHRLVVRGPGQGRCDLAVPVGAEDGPAALLVQHRELVGPVVAGRLLAGQEGEVRTAMAVARGAEVPVVVLQQGSHLAGLDLDLGEGEAVVQALLGAGVAGEGDAAPIRRHVEAVGVRLAAAQLPVRAFKEVHQFAGGDVHHMQMRHPAHRDLMVPVAIQGLLGDIGRVLAGLEVFQRLCLRGGLEVRPDPGHEGDAPSVGKPFERFHPGGHLAHAARLAAVRRDDVELGLGVLHAAVLAPRRERDQIAARAPLRVGVLVAGLGQPARLAPQRRQQPQAAARLVVLHAVAGDAGDGLGAIRAQAGFTDAVQGPQGVDVEGGAGRRVAGLRGFAHGRGRWSCQCRWALTSGHSPAVRLYITVSRTVPSRRRPWWRSTPSRLAPRRSMARCEAWLKLSVRQPTSRAPRVSKAWVSSSSLAVVLTALRCARRAYQV